MDQPLETYWQPHCCPPGYGHTPPVKPKRKANSNDKGAARIRLMLAFLSANPGVSCKFIAEALDANRSQYMEKTIWLM